MKALLPLSSLAALLAAALPFPAAPLRAADGEAPAKSIYDFRLRNIDGKEVSLDDYRGKVLLIVNVASECGATPQYAGLAALHRKYAEQGLVVLGFPANNFGGQEPGTNEEIKRFCAREFGVAFPMFARLSVDGQDQDALFKHLTAAGNADFTGPIRWNFEKFLVGRDGRLLRRFRTGTEPDAPELTGAVEEAIRAQPAAGGGCEDC